MENKWKYIMLVTLGIGILLLIAFILFLSQISNIIINYSDFYRIDTDSLIETYFGIDTHCVVNFQNISYDGICQRDVLQGIGEAINYEYAYQHRIDLLSLCNKLPDPETWNNCKDIMNPDILTGGFTAKCKMNFLNKWYKYGQNLSYGKSVWNLSFDEFVVEISKEEGMIEALDMFCNELE